MNYNSLKNQGIISNFVNREVYTCVTSMVEYILKQEGDDKPFDYNDLENVYIDNSDKIKELEEKIEELESKLNTLENEREIENIENQINDLKNEVIELENEQDEPNEVYEFWIVSGWLCNKLKELGEVVISSENIWGRGCTGQSISLDYVIWKICEDMKILEGQKNKWK
ncbi:hypothetical protein ACF12F_003056 [Clostridioides difficile]|uniref:hypothetical protein n=1 Tax=Clostridioides difficile TaxID=1496 RepID=UPI00016C69F1|nr:hypothetical protein [Clostridioides difficile]EGT4199019.1 hypothetical protein [Clostridioides difficile]EGT5004820.1 hypothetical protein [Clostridioides difficile]EKG0777102.1 hypothetical protein [Clostridioides difficile]EKG0781018.1 hypothetical protein [Clostridioides difficile]EKG0813102.1 hypothetical protein [Clostridioides difficile]